MDGRLNWVTISIITPSFNQGQFLEETIQSVLSQEGDFLLEYIIIDGGSTDNSVEIIRRYDDAIRAGTLKARCRGISFQWVSEKDRGQAEAINKGFRRVTGDLVAWINSDDTYLPGTLPRILHYFSAHPDAMVLVGDAIVIDESGRRISKYIAEFLSYERMIAVWEGRGNTIPQPSVFFRRSVLESVGLLDTSLSYTMDFDFFLRCSSKFNFSKLAEPLATYRIHSASKTMSGYDSMAWESYRVSRKHWKQLPLTKYIKRWNDLLRGESQRCFRVAQETPMADRRKRRRYLLKGSLIYPPRLWNQDNFSLVIRGIVGDVTVESLKRHLRSSNIFRVTSSLIVGRSRVERMLAPKFIPPEIHGNTDFDLTGVFEDKWTTERFEVSVREPGTLSLQVSVRSVFTSNPRLKVTHQGREQQYELPRPGDFSLQLRFEAAGTARFHVSDVFCPVELNESSDNRLLSLYIALIDFIPSSHLVGRTVAV
jgi:glycosyltransferase involved in cell wall biosynthesis